MFEFHVIIYTIFIVYYYLFGKNYMVNKLFRTKLLVLVLLSNVHEDIRSGKASPTFGHAMHIFLCL